MESTLANVMTNYPRHKNKKKTQERLLLFYLFKFFIHLGFLLIFLFLIFFMLQINYFFQNKNVLFFIEFNGIFSSIKQIFIFTTFSKKNIIFEIS